MKRFLIPAIFSLAIHGLVIMSDFKEMVPMEKVMPKIKFMSMTLAYQENKKPEPQTVVKKKVAEKKAAEKKVAEKKAAEKKAAEKKVAEKKVAEKKVAKKKTVKKRAIKKEQIEKPPPEKEIKPAPEEKLKEPEKDLLEKAPEKKQEVIEEEKKVEKGGGVTAVVRNATPLVSNNPSPRYPRSARVRGYQGLVELEALVGIDGRVQELRVLSSSGYAVLDRAAVKSVRRWLFEPGMKGDRRIEMWVRVPVRFQLN